MDYKLRTQLAQKILDKVNVELAHHDEWDEEGLTEDQVEEITEMARNVKQITLWFD